MLIKEFREHLFQYSLGQYVASIIASLGCISDGMHYGWSAPAYQTLHTSEFPIKNAADYIGYIQSLYVLGGIVGIPIGIYCQKQISRKKTLIFANLLSCSAWMLVGFVESVHYLLFARLLAGIAGNLAITASPMYVAEIATKKNQRVLTYLTHSFVLLGILTIYSLLPFVSIKASAIIATSILLFQGCALLLLPESPYDLIKHNQCDSARAILNLFGGTDDQANARIEQINQRLDTDKNIGNCLHDLFQQRCNQKAVRILLMLISCQYFTGISAIVMNLQNILMSIGNDQFSASLIAITFVGIMLIMGIVLTLVIMDRCDRCTLLLVSSFSSGICLMIIAGYFAANKYLPNSIAGCKWLPTASILFYAAFNIFGNYTIVNIISPVELFSVQFHYIVFIMLQLVAHISNLVTIGLFQWCTKMIGMYVPFLIFAIAMFPLTTLYCFRCVPETRGKSLEEIHLELKADS